LDTAELRPHLEAKIQEIKKTLDDPEISGTHLNEANTELVVIDPLLQLLGYSPLVHMFKRGHDSVANNFPDYTLLPNTPHKWFLEVKKLDLNLQAGEAAQAVNYAANQGAEWAVLTNGRTWYIYNAHLPKPLIEKRVMQIHDLFADADGIETLLLLSRQSMQSEGLKKAWVHERLIAMVKNQLETPNSTVRKHLRKIGSEEIGTALDDAAIGRAITDCGMIGLKNLPEITMDPLPSTTSPMNSTSFIVPPPQKVNASPRAAYYTFEEIGKDEALTSNAKNTPKKTLKTLQFSDGHSEEVYYWADVAKVVVEWIGQTYKLPPLPFSTGSSSKNYFLNFAPLQSDNKKMIKPRVVYVDGQRVYIDIKKDARHIVANLAHLLASVVASPNAVKIRLLR
jgi:hypothetical protein